MNTDYVPFYERLGDAVYKDGTLLGTLREVPATPALLVLARKMCRVEEVITRISKSYYTEKHRGRYSFWKVA